MMGPRRRHRFIRVLPVVALVILGIAHGCDTFNLTDEFAAADSGDGVDSGLPLSIQPSVAAVQFGGEVVFEGSGGVLPYRYELGNPTLGSIDSGGVFTAGNATTDGFIWVKDESGAATAAIVYVYDGASGSALGLTVQYTEIDRSETSVLFPTGGSPPYTLSIPISPTTGSHDDVYPASPSAGQRGEILNNTTYDPGNYIGTVIVRVTDDAGDTAEASIKVKAQPPSDFAAASASQAIDLSWQFDSASPGIVEFVIERSTEGSTYVAVDPGLTTPFNGGSSSYAITDTEPSNNDPRWYKITAVTSNPSYDSDPAGPVFNVAGP